MGIDHTLQAIQYNKRNSPKLFKRKYGYHLRELEFSNISIVVFGAEKVETHFFALACTLGWHKQSCNVENEDLLRL